MKVRYLELHSELFHAGKNFGKKLDPEGVHRGLDYQINWDEKNRWFSVSYQNRTCYIFTTNVCTWEPYVFGEEIKVPVNEHKTEDKSKRSKAQVATPHSHVFEGRGQGVTGLSTKV